MPSSPSPSLPFPHPTALLTSPTFALATPTESDVDAMAAVYCDSFGTDPLCGFWWSPDRGAQTAWLRRRVAHKLLRDPRARHFKVVDVPVPIPVPGGAGGGGGGRPGDGDGDGDGELVAWARWTVPEAAGAAFGEGAVTATAAGAAGAPAEGDGGGAAEVVDYPEGADPALCRSFYDALTIAKKKWNADSMLGLAVLCTSPKYFKRGAAKALLVPMLEIADAEGLRTYVEATAAGKPVYEKLGFKQVDVLRFDLAKLMPGRDDVAEFAIMIREPQSKGC